MEKQIYLTFEFNEPTEELFTKEEEYYFNNEYFIQFIDEIPKTFEEYKEIINKDGDKSILIFVLTDLFVKIYKCDFDEYNDFFNGFGYRNSKFDILKRILQMIDNYFMFFHYTEDKESYMNKLAHQIENIGRNKLNKFIKQMNDNFELIYNELETKKIMFDYLTRLKAKNLN